MDISKKDYNLCKNAVRSAIRKSFSRSEHYKGFLKLHRIETHVGKRFRVFYKCNECEGLCPQNQINVDHINPIGKGVYNGIEDAKSFYELVYCPYSNLQILCKECHSLKTKRENKSPSFSNMIF